MKVRFIISSIVLVVLISFFVTGQTGIEKKGVVTYTDGQVKRKQIQTENWEDAPVNTAVLSGDMVRTYQQSRAELDLSKIDIIRLAPRTIIDIVKLYEETKENRVKTEIKLQKGELWASVHQVEANTDFDISAPVAAAAITGTVLRMSVDDDTTTKLKVYEGEVKITNSPQRTDISPQMLVPKQVPGPHQIEGPHEVSVVEWVYIVKSMQQITIDRRGKVVSSGTFKPKSKEERTSWVEWNKNRDTERLKSIKNQ